MGNIFSCCKNIREDDLVEIKIDWSKAGYNEDDIKKMFCLKSPHNINGVNVS